MAIQVRKKEFISGGDQICMYFNSWAYFISEFTDKCNVHYWIQLV